MQDGKNEKRPIFEEEELADEENVVEDKSSTDYVDENVGAYM